MGSIALNISNIILFHLNGLTTPLTIWTKLYNFFGIVNEFQALQLDAELTSLTPASFPNIEDFLMKFKSLCIVCRDVGEIK